jgi:hypothetical protein
VFRICVNYSEKRSTIDQFQNATIGATVEAANLELSTPDAIVEKTKQLFVLARSAVQQQLLDVVPERGRPENGNGHAHGNGHRDGNGHNGNGRSFGRPSPEPSPKQRVLLKQLADSHGLSAEAVGEIARRELGKSVPQLNRLEMSRLLQKLMDPEVRP